MGAKTKIEWCDHTASPWYGCAHREFEDGTTHPGCLNCYAETMSARNPSTPGVWGEDGVRVKSKSFIANLRKWNREAEAAGKPVSVFPSLCDPFEDRPELEPWRAEMFAVLDQCPWVRLLLLTKRPENVRRMWACPRGEQCDYCRHRTVGPHHMHRDNVWLGTSISNQPTADRMIPELLKCRELVPVLFLSAEPLLGPPDLTAIQRCDGWTVDALWGVYSRHHDEGIDHPAALEEHGDGPHIDWVIVGGESGPGARPMHPDWARSLRDQCQAAGVPLFFKQWGEWKPISEMESAEWDRYYAPNRKALPHENQTVINELYGRRCTIATQAIRFDGEHGDGLRFLDAIDGHPAFMTFRVGKKAAGRLLDGREWSEFPAAAFANK